MDGGRALASAIPEAETLINGVEGALHKGTAYLAGIPVVGGALSSVANSMLNSFGLGSSGCNSTSSGGLKGMVEGLIPSPAVSNGIIDLTGATGFSQGIDFNPWDESDDEYS